MKAIEGGAKSSVIETTGTTFTAHAAPPLEPL